VTQATEKAAQATIVDLATLLGWLSYHTFDSRSSSAGFPDLVFVRDRRILFVEVKKVGEKPRPDQGKWLDALVSADCETYVWTIDDLPEITEILQCRHRLAGLRSSWPSVGGRLDTADVRDTLGQAGRAA